MSLSQQSGDKLSVLLGDPIRSEIATRLNGNFGSDAVSCGALTASSLALGAGGLTRTGSKINQGGARVKIGTAAGWAITGLNTGAMATMAASQSAGTISVMLSGFKVGDTITGYDVYSSINSVGGAVTLDAALRTMTIAAGATATDAAVASGSIAQVAVSAATASTATVTGLSTVVAAGVQYYLLITGTTAAVTTIELDNIDLVINSA